ncbi:MAG: 3-oxoacyl-[acyl-carrier-protein] reductase [Anaerolineae bacterium]
MDLTGRVAVVTGASRGIGKAIAVRLAAQGAAVVVNYRADAAGAAEVVEEIGAAGGQAQVLQADVSVPEQAEEMVKQALAWQGRIDILVNNAGITRDTLLMRMGMDDWDTVLNTNLKGAFVCTRACLRPMMKQRYGRIVNISSVSGVVGNVGQANYAAAKAGLIGFTKAVAKEVGSRNITVNAVAPGFVLTTLTRDLPDELKARIVEVTALGRFGTPEEIAAAVAFFASDEAAFITGQVLCVDGGLAM